MDSAYQWVSMPRGFHRWFIWLVLIACGGVAGYLVPPALLRGWTGQPVEPAVASPAPVDAGHLLAEYAASIQPVLADHCLDCHDGTLRKGGLDLEVFKDLGAMIAARPKWKSIRSHVATNLMPPPDEDPLTAADKDRLIDWIDRAIFPVDPARPDPGVFTIRRLNRAEYAFTIRDLLGVEVDASILPDDDSGYGFDNIGDVLSIAPAHLERYQQLAEHALALALDPVVPEHRRPRELPAGQWRGNGSDNGGDYLLFMAGEASVGFTAREAGEFALALDVSADQAGPDKAAFEVLIDGSVIAAGRVNADNGGREMWQGKAKVAAGKHQLAVRFTNDYWDPQAADGRKDRNLRVHRAIVEGPVDGPPPAYPATRARLWPARASGVTDDQHARQVLAAFLPRAFRRPVGDGEITRYENFSRSAREAGEPAESALRMAMEAALVSPDFLFRGLGELREGVQRGGIARVSEYELANRLSYFLWSSMPDDHLADLAARGALSANLMAEVERMLADPRAAALVDRFFLQWLRVRDIEVVQPDAVMFGRAFTPDVRAAMLDETRVFCRHLLTEDRPAIEMLTADYTFANPTLRAFYGLPDNGGGPEPRRVSLAGTGRQGILTHASVLTLTSHPTRTSPVKRGQWVMDTILDQAPPPPPPNVPSLESLRDIPEDAPLRVKLVAHQANPACAACHKLMDGVGFSFEHFDAIGRWRDRDGQRPVDAKGDLASGEKFDGAGQLISVLAGKKRADFHRALAARMLTFALGRGLDYFDEPAVAGIVAAAGKDDWRMTAFIRAVVTAYPFQHRRLPEDPTTTPPSQ